MFLLIDNDKTYYLLTDGKYIVGRHGDIVIKNHTISRKHAEISIQNNEVCIRDCESKYFTKYNGKILLKNEVTKLEDDGEILFGEVAVLFKRVETFITCSTGIKNNEEELKKLLQEIGGEYRKDWSESCTHLTTPEIMVTLKLLHAIMDNKKIVTPNFWKVVSQNITQNKPLPDPSEFYPPIAENMIPSKYLDYNPNRGSLFSNKTFAFWRKKKQQTSLQDIITKAGGECIFITELKNTSDKEIMNKLDDYIVIDPEDKKIESTYSNIIEAYVKKGRRVIPIQEVVLAILQCSCKENCNPHFERAKTVFARNTPKPSTSKIVVAETECFSTESQKELKPDIIPSSFDMDNYTNIKNVEKKDVTHSIRLDTKVERQSLQKSAFLSKRPATESLTSPAPKKSKKDEDMKLNPFSVMKTRMNAKESTSSGDTDLDLSNNPFVNVQLKGDLKKEVELDDVVLVNDTKSTSTENNIKKRKNEDSLDTAISRKVPKIVTKSNRKFIEIKPINFSEMEHSVSSGTWIDKNVKYETKPVSSSLEEDEQKWCEKFINSVVIVSKNLWRKDKGNVTSKNLTSNQSNIENYKKFKKTPFPRSGQIIKCSVSGNSN